MEERQPKEQFFPLINLVAGIEVLLVLSAEHSQKIIFHSSGWLVGHLNSFHQNNWGEVLRWHAGKPDPEIRVYLVFVVVHILQYSF